MLKKIEYMKKDGGAVIVRCYGESTSLCLPSFVDGLPVVGLADHCFAAESSVLVPGNVRISFYVDSWENHPVPAASDDEAAGMDPDICTGLEKLILPDSVKEIGSYAFYGCRLLHTLVLPTGPLRLGSGVFVACNHIRLLCFDGREETLPLGMRDVVSELDYEVNILVRKGEETLLGLVFPGYYEDSVENTPARIIEVKYEGTGYKYRQCFHRGSLDLKVYDSYFYEASVQETRGTALKLALGRVLFPHELEEKAKEAYLSFLQVNAGMLAKQLLSEEWFGLDFAGAVAALIRAHFFTKEILEDWIAGAARKHEAQAVSLLMDYRQKQFPIRKKTYTF